MKMAQLKHRPEVKRSGVRTIKFANFNLAKSKFENMPTRLRRLVKIIESDTAAQLESEINAFLDTISFDSFMDVEYRPLQTAMGTCYTTMILYRQSFEAEDELKESDLLK
jgi:hypothetical protein